MLPIKNKAVIGKALTRFNGVDLQRENELGVTVLKQSQYIKNIEIFCFKKHLSFEDFRVIRAKHAYIAFSMVPDTFIYNTFLAQITKERQKMELKYL